MNPPPEPDERFADWVDDRLSAADRRRLERELERDAELRGRLALYVEAVEQLRSSRDDERAPANLADAVLAEIDGGEPAAVIPHPSSRRWLPLAGSLAAAAALIAVGVFLWQLDAGRAVRTDTALVGSSRSEAADDGPTSGDLGETIKLRAKAGSGELRSDGSALAGLTAAAPTPAAAAEGGEQLERQEAQAPDSETRRALVDKVVLFEQKQEEEAIPEPSRKAPTTPVPLTERLGGRSNVEPLLESVATLEKERESDDSKDKLKKADVSGNKPADKPLPPLPFPAEEAADEDEVAAGVDRTSRARRAAERPAQAPAADPKAEGRYIAKGPTSPGPAARGRPRAGKAGAGVVGGDKGGSRVVGFPVVVVTVPAVDNRVPKSQPAEPIPERELTRATVGMATVDQSAPSWLEPGRDVAASQPKLVEIPLTEVVEIRRDQLLFAAEQAPAFRSMIGNVDLTAGDRVFAVTGVPAQIEGYLKALNTTVAKRGGQVRLLRAKPDNDAWMARLTELRASLIDEQAKQVVGQRMVRRAQTQQQADSSPTASELDMLWVVLRAQALAPAVPEQRK